MNYNYLEGKERKEIFNYLKENSRGEKSSYDHNWVVDTRGNEFLEVYDEYYNSYEYYDLNGKNIAYADGDYPICVYN